MIYLDLQKHTLSRSVCCDARVRRKRSFDENLLGADFEMLLELPKKTLESRNKKTRETSWAHEERCGERHRKEQILKVRPVATFCARLRDIALVVRTSLGPPNLPGLRLACWPKLRA